MFRRKATDLGRNILFSQMPQMQQMQHTQFRSFSELTHVGTPRPKAPVPQLPFLYAGAHINKELSQHLEIARRQSPMLHQVLNSVEEFSGRGVRRLQQLESTLDERHDFHQVEGLKQGMYDRAVRESLTVHESEGVTPHYDVDTNTVSTKRSMGMNALGHELDHHNTHQSGQFDLRNPPERLASEEHAFQTQETVGRELGEHALVDNLFEGRTPQQMAKNYEGKKNYPGTLEESRALVAQRHSDLPVSSDRHFSL